MNQTPSNSGFPFQRHLLLSVYTFIQIKVLWMSNANFLQQDFYVVFYLPVDGGPAAY